MGRVTDLPLASLALFLGACGSGGEAQPLPSGPAWAEVLRWEPDPQVVTDASLRKGIADTGLPWRVRDAASGIELLLVPPGEYRRGAPDDDAEAAEDERPAHRVVVERPFYLGRTEVTQGQWQAVMGDQPSHFAGDPERPVEQVDRLAIQDFLQRTGLALPTEGQWEYACRAGDPAARYGPLDEVAWHRGNADFQVHAVARRRANALGFHDLLGNVWEWTDSWYREGFYARFPPDGTALEGPPMGVYGVLRGGSWYDPPARLRASARYRALWDFAAGHVGLRVARAAE